MNLKKLLINLTIPIYVLIYFLAIVRFIPNHAMLLNCIYIGAITLANYSLYKWPKNRAVFEEEEEKIVRFIIYAVFVYFTLIYLLGIITGYVSTSYSLKPLSIIRNSFLPLVSIVLLEILRYISINNIKEKKYMIINTMLIILLDIVVCYYRFNITLVDIFIFLSVIVLPIIFKNIMLSFMTYRAGIRACLIYIVPLGIYSYFVPLFPDLSNYLKCIINMCLPAFVFIHTARLLYDDGKNEGGKIKIARTIFDTILILFFFVFISLISGVFSYQLIGIDTSNIENKIKRGDAVIIYKGYDYDEYQKGDIITYYSGKKIIIDVITDVEVNEYGEHSIKVNKVLENNKVKEYKVITEEELIGIYNNFRIGKIAYPTIKFKEFIKGDVNEKK